MHSAFVKHAARCTLALFIASQISGCLTLPVAQSISDIANEAVEQHKGKTSPETQRNSQSAELLFKHAVTMPRTLSYQSKDFKNLYQQFKSAKNTLAATNGQFNQQQLLALTQSLSQLMLYIDRVEGLRHNKTIQNAPTNTPSFNLQTGHLYTFDIEGFCLDKELIAAPAGEPFRLEPIDQFVPNNLQPAYFNLLKQHQQNFPKDERTQAAHHADPRTQNLAWALRGLKTGKLKRQDLNQLTTEQQRLLEQGTGTSTGGLAAQAAAKNIISGLHSAYANSILGQGVNAVRDLTSDTPQQTYSTPDSAHSTAQVKLGPIIESPYSSAYTLLDYDVAARAVSTAPLRTRVEVINLSAQPFTFTPTAYAFNSRSANSQAVGPAQWDMDKDQIFATSDAATNELLETIANDLYELSTLKGLEELAHKGALGANLIANGMLKSKVALSLLSAAPIVGNLINLGSILTGKNLDGSNMTATDYIMAGIGVVPIAGNIAKALKPAGAKIFANELASIDRFYERYKNPMLAADLLTTDTSALLFERSGAPDWLKQNIQSASQNTLNAIKQQMPQTAHYLQAAL